MTRATQIADRYISVWNETDPARRQALLAQDWSETAAYVDPMMAGKGRVQISALIGAVHERFPGFRFTLDGRVDGYGDRVRFSWALGSTTEPDLIKGTDFVLVEDGRVSSVTGFLDKVPASV
ncbi:MAG TPA: nuclear transport factor 2 family protein [Burkholderiaceae bacterium]|jgi:hypothetical protein